ncbi:MAG TPA: DUF1365 domain-containing protein [Solirubrobacterales bacterium]|nr:DUF1365 domain-containing protein [Solirubrobacterales bacterium]
MISAIYEGRIGHTRTTPVHRSFSYRIFMLYLDLDELRAVFALHPLWGPRRRAPARYRRADYMGPAERPLRACVLDRVEAATGSRPDGPVRMLTHLRYFGSCFNPVTFYYCFAADAHAAAANPADAAAPNAAPPPVAAVAEVTNTPWGERHAYVIPRQDEGGLSAGLAKAFHVSPLMGMEHNYRVELADPADHLTARIASYPHAEGDGAPTFDALLELRRTELSRAALGRVLTTYPPMPLLVHAGIYTQAARTWLRGARWHAHP